MYTNNENRTCTIISKLLLRVDVISGSFPISIMIEVGLQETLECGKDLGLPNELDKAIPCIGNSIEGTET